jgi:hypothetical protein
MRISVHEICLKEPMKFRYWVILVIMLGSVGFALDGEIGIHTPATIIQYNGMYYTFCIGGRSLTSSKQPNDEVHLIWNRTLDPNSADFKGEEGRISSLHRKLGRGMEANLAN